MERQVLVGLFSDLNDPLVRDVVNTAPVKVSEPVKSLHGAHCFEWQQVWDDQPQVLESTLVCGWPDEHVSANPFLV